MGIAWDVLSQKVEELTERVEADGAVIAGLHETCVRKTEIAFNAIRENDRLKAENARLTNQIRAARIAADKAEGVAQTRQQVIDRMDQARASLLADVSRLEGHIRGLQIAKDTWQEAAESASKGRDLLADEVCKLQAENARLKEELETAAGAARSLEAKCKALNGVSRPAPEIEHITIRYRSGVQSDLVVTEHHAVDRSDLEETLSKFLS